MASLQSLMATSLDSLRSILPLDDTSLEEIIKYTLELPGPSEAAAHLKELLGESPEAFDFIHFLCSRGWPSKGIRGLSLPSQQDKHVPMSNLRSNTASSSKTSGLAKPSVQSAVSPQPSDIGRAYKKGDDSDLMAYGGKKGKQHETRDQINKSVDHSKAESWAVASSSKSPKKQLGTLTSELGRSKKSRSDKKASTVSEALASSRSSQSIKVHSLQEVEDAIKTLELEYKDNKNRSKCDCQAQRHPLLEIAPNCLNCGKIICVKEGVGPCTFCNTPLLAQAEYDAIVSELRQERGQLKSEIHNEQIKKSINNGSSRPSYSIRAGGLSNASLSSLEKANRQLTNLLEFQESSAQRTKIIDNASDFEMIGSALDRWATPAERALQLKKQQRTRKQMEALERMRNGRGKRVVSIDLRGNKVVTTVHSEVESLSSDDDSVNDEIDQSSTIKDQMGTRIIKYDPEKDRINFIKPLYVRNDNNNKNEDNSSNKNISAEMGQNTVELGIQDILHSLGNGPAKVQDEVEYDYRLGEVSILNSEDLDEIAAEKLRERESTKSERINVTYAAKPKRNEKVDQDVKLLFFDDSSITYSQQEPKRLQQPRQHSNLKLSKRSPDQHRPEVKVEGLTIADEGNPAFESVSKNGEFQQGQLETNYTGNGFNDKRSSRNGHSHTRPRGNNEKRTKGADSNRS
ncbi:hypothetical protein V1511DRAFT_491737 [Dipodascopsis uninucleata]